ncbi:MAG TPA: BON domain-containing protein [Pyrinomonadaceae bacterium]|nr:BON domain-containing protein [Pyrinomonadaceae bacterium]
MSHEEEQHKRSRVVVETPTARREVVQHQTVRYPTEERRGYSAGIVATVALLAIAATAIIFLFLTNSRDSSTEANVNLRTTAATQPTPMTQAPVVVQTPLTQPTPVIIQQVPAPVTTTQPAPVIIQAPPPPDTSTTTAPASPPASAAPPAGHDDASLQTKIDKAFADDPNVSAASIDALVVNGRVKLTGTVSSDAVKQRAERLAYAVKGVLGVDNKIVVAPATP